MEAIVLAGGLGTRLRSVVSELPKPMAPVRSKPFLSYILSYLKKNGVKRVILSVGYKWDTIFTYFGESFEGIELCYSIEEEPLGTGGAIKKAISQAKEQKIYIINGDTFFDVPLQQLSSELNDNSGLVLSLKTMFNFDRYGCVEIDRDGQVSSFSEKGYKEKGNINGGIYLVSVDIFDTYHLEEKFSFETFMEVNVKSLTIRACVFDNYFIDIGIPDDYERAQHELNEHV